MATSQSTRPRFFEQQYLDAEDLAALVEYSRLARSRHDLGAHTWGIGVGLQIAEVEGPTGVELYIQPGYAWDGFGRPVVVTAPYRIPADLFSSIPFDAGLDNSSDPGRPVDIWLEYVESPVGGPENGFSVCTTDEQYKRIAESFRIRVGDRPAPEDRRDPVNVGGRVDDAERAVQIWGSSSDGVIADASIPYQTFPSPEDGATWLIPLGIVRWLPSANPTLPGNFVSRTDGDLEASDRKRRYAGVVAETINASRGFIRLRNRYDSDEPKVWSDDLVWCEGSLRVSGDTNILGGKLSFRDQNNGDAGTQFTLRRMESNSVELPGRGKDMVAQIGSEDKGLNRFVVGPIPEGEQHPAEVLVVRDNGTVGVGTSGSDNPLTIRGQSEDERSIGLESEDGRLIWQISQKADGQSGLNINETGNEGSRLFIKSGGNVGINTASPENQLHVEGNTGIRQNHLYMSGGARGANSWCSISYNAHHNPMNSAWVFPDPAKTAVSVEMDDRDGSPRFVVQTTTTSNKTSWVPRFSIDGNSGAITAGGRMTVEGALRVEGSTVITGSTTTSGGLSVGANAAVTGRADIGGSARVAGTLDVGGAINVASNAGIGVSSPGTRLHVADTKAGAANLVNSHVACIENLSASTNADVLALKVGYEKPTEGSNFITFFGGGTAVGAIEGNGSGGIKFRSTGADYAELIPRLDPDDKFEKGDIVGIINGFVTHTTKNADHILAISTSPIVLGNTPPTSDSRPHEQVAMLGQVEVKVAGAVNTGDIILASDNDDGVGIAVRPEDFSLSDFGRVLGSAWESNNATDVKLVRVGIGLTMNKLFGAVGAQLARLTG